MIDDSQIETQRVAGDITLILKEGTDAERESLLRVIGQLCGDKEKARLEEWVKNGMEGA